MKKILIPAALLLGGSLWIGELGAHGGTYRGPGDTVPPGAGGGGGGGPATGGPAGPGGGAGPSTGGPVTGGPAAPPAAGSSGGGVSTGTETGPDLELWSFWWEFNKDPFLNLKAAIYAGGTKTGEDGFFLGDGSAEDAKDQLRPDEAMIRSKIVPALLAALKSEKANDIVTGCLIALAKIGDTAAEGGESEFAREIARFLKDGSQEIRETAAIALGILAHPSSLPLLDGLVNDTKVGQDALGTTTVDLRTRAFAAYGLGLMARNNSNPDLQKKIAQLAVQSLPNAARQATQDVAVAVLTSFGLTQLPAAGLVSTKESPLEPWSSVEGAIEYLATSFEDESLNRLLRAHFPVAMGRMLNQPGFEAAPTYAAMKDRVAAALLLPLDPRKGKSWEEELRQSAAFALGLIGDSDDDKLDAEIRKTLIAQTLDGQRQTRRFAMIALAKAAARPGTQGEKEFDSVKEVEKHLVKRLREAKGGDEHWAALSLGVLGNFLREHDLNLTDAPAELREQFKGAKNTDGTGAFAVALGILKEKDAEKDLIERLEKTGEMTAQGYVCLGLGLMGSSAAKQKIQEIIKKSEFRPDLLKQAAIALGLLGDNQLVQDLTEMLANANTLAAQAAIASALGFIGDQRSIDPLVKMLEDTQLTDGARGFAAVALGIVADKERLPWNSKIAVDVNYRASTQTLNTQDGKGVLNIL